MVNLNYRFPTNYDFVGFNHSRATPFPASKGRNPRTSLSKRTCFARRHSAEASEQPGSRDSYSRRKSRELGGDREQAPMSARPFSRLMNDMEPAKLGKRCQALSSEDSAYHLYSFPCLPPLLATVHLLLPLLSLEGDFVSSTLH